MKVTALETAPRRVVFLAYEGVSLIDLSGPIAALTAACASTGSAPPPYTWEVVSLAGGPIGTFGGVPIVSTQAGAADRIDTLVVPGGGQDAVERASRDDGLLKWLRRATKRARRVCSVCTGAYLLAGVGLLAGRRAVTHWANCDDFARRYPEVRVDPDAVYLRDGDVWTSAGVTAGIDLTLALVEEDLGRAVASQAARLLVVYLRRPAGQTQYSALLRAQSARDSGRFEALHHWIGENLSEDLRVERLAERVGMSPRNFARVYRKATGETPARTVERMRLEGARRELVETADPLRHIAHRCGFGDEEALRLAFVRRFGVSPREYRARFR